MIERKWKKKRNLKDFKTRQHRFQILAIELSMLDYTYLNRTAKTKQKSIT